MLPKVTGCLDDGHIAVVTQDLTGTGHPESGAGKIATCLRRPRRPPPDCAGAPQGAISHSRWRAAVVPRPTPVPAHAGTDRVQLVPPHTGQRRPMFSQATGRPDRRSPSWSSSTGATSANAARYKHNMPSPTGQISGTANYHNRRQRGRGGQGVASPWPPSRSYHAPARGQSRTKRASVPMRAAPGLARGRASARPTGRHTSPSVQDRRSGPSLGRRTSKSIEKLEK
jgi:hypothetical protein